MCSMQRMSSPWEFGLKTSDAEVVHQLIKGKRLLPYFLCHTRGVEAV